MFIFVVCSWDFSFSLFLTFNHILFFLFTYSLSFTISIYNIQNMNTQNRDLWFRNETINYYTCDSCRLSRRRSYLNYCKHTCTYRAASMVLRVALDDIGHWYMRVIVTTERIMDARWKELDEWRSTNDARRDADACILYPAMPPSRRSVPRIKSVPAGRPFAPRRRNQNTDGTNASSVARDDLLVFRLRVLRLLIPQFLDKKRSMQRNLLC